MGGAQSTAAAGGATAAPATAATAAAAAAPGSNTAGGTADAKKPTLANRMKGVGSYLGGKARTVGSYVAGSVAKAGTYAAQGAVAFNKSVGLTAAETKLKALDLKEAADSGIPIFVLGLATLAYVIAAVVCSFSFETPTNIRRISQKALVPWLPYGTDVGNRRSMSDTLDVLSSKVEKDKQYLTNFFIRTANIAGILFGDGGRPVASLDAIRFALLGGARAFVFDLWPDTAPGDAHRGPVLMTLEPGSAQRRTSYNSIPLVSALSQLIYVAFNAKYASIENDLIIIYLRFRTQPVPNMATFKDPRQDTMEITAKALQATIQPYRLDAAFNRCRAQATIPMLPLKVFAKKVIVVSNTNGAGSTLADYINVGPQAGNPVEYEHTYYKQIEANKTMLLNAVSKIQQNLSFTAPLGEDPAAASNAWDVMSARKIGVHCCAMNMDPKKMPPPIATMFAKDSFVYKGDAKVADENIVYAPPTLPNPQTTPDLGLGGGLSAGSIRT